MGIYNSKEGIVVSYIPLILTNRQGRRWMTRELSTLWPSSRTSSRSHELPLIFLRRGIIIFCSPQTRNNLFSLSQIFHALKIIILTKALAATQIKRRKQRLWWIADNFSFLSNFYSLIILTWAVWLVTLRRLLGEGSGILSCALVVVYTDLDLLSKAAHQSSISDG